MSYTYYENDINLGLAIATNEAKVLVNEVCFKYGFKVLRTVDRVSANQNNSFLLVKDGWCPVGEVFTRTVHDDDDNPYTEYCYYSYFYEKARGTSREDKRTIRSKKISTLMTTIKKVRAIPNNDHMLHMHARQWTDNIKSYENSLGKEHKETNVFSSYELHAILNQLVGESPNTNITADIQNKCKSVLDKYNQIDKINTSTQAKLNEIFGKPFYVLGVNGVGDIVVGVMKCEDPSQSVRSSAKFEVVKPMKIVKTIDEYPELLAVVTMFNTQHGEDDKHRYGGILPAVTKVNKELDFVIDYEWGLDSYRFIWAMTPCSFQD